MSFFTLQNWASFYKFKFILGLKPIPIHIYWPAADADVVELLDEGESYRTNVSCTSQWRLAMANLTGWLARLGYLFGLFGFLPQVRYPSSHRSKRQRTVSVGGNSVGPFRGSPCLESG